MGEKIFVDSKDCTVEGLIKKINDIIGEEFSILQDEDRLEKWNTLPKLLVLGENQKKRLLEFIDFVDSLLVPVSEKIIYIISLCGLLEYGKLKIDEYDCGSLFTLADYYQNSSIYDIKNTIGIIGNQNLLLVVREKTLDLEVRKQMLSDILNRANTITNKKELNQFLMDVIQEYKEKNYYDLVG